MCSDTIRPYPVNLLGQMLGQILGQKYGLEGLVHGKAN